jgi:hypothetical protein
MPGGDAGGSARVGLPGLQCGAGALLRGSSELVDRYTDRESCEGWLVLQGNEIYTSPQQLGIASKAGKQRCLLGGQRASSAAALPSGERPPSTRRV